MHRLLALTLLFAGCSDTISPEPWDVSELPGGDHVSEPVSESEPEDDRLVPDATSAWAGLWLVDQPLHALYEGTVYDFRPDGTLEEIESLLLATPDWGSEVGVVAKCTEFETYTNEDCSTNGTECETVQLENCLEWGPICTFGERWGARDERTLMIQGDCDDGNARTIELHFPDDVSSLPEDVPVWERRFAPERIEVEGEAWEHNWFRWTWSRCEGGAEACLPDF